MTESALSARLKLHTRASAPMEGGLGETMSGGLGFNSYAGGSGGSKIALGGQDATLKAFCIVLSSVLLASSSQRRVFIDFGVKIDSKLSQNRLKIVPKIIYFRGSVPRILRERFFDDFRLIFDSRAQAPNLQNRAPVRA